ncbi:MAG: aminoacyl-tRNA hydrolase [Lachnospiraceae bacterium]|jgi:PTH1 family peptidyl-tRNA hydrolase
MYLIVGLGNPTKVYEKTRHNVGFDAIDELIDRENIPQAGVRNKAMFGKGMIGGQKVILAKPLTYMNLSGEAVRGLIDYFKIDPEEELIVLYDDIDLDPGKLRIRKSGSAGGHNGMKNIIQHLGTQKFCRIRIGVGAKPEGWDLADYVLGHFGKEERKCVDEAIGKACDAVKMILEEDINAAMNKYN